MRMIAHMTRLNAVQKLLRTDFIADPWAAAAAAFHGACPRAVLLARAPLRVPTRDLASVLKASHQGADLGACYDAVHTCRHLRIRRRLLRTKCMTATHCRRHSRARAVESRSALRRGLPVPHTVTDPLSGGRRQDRLPVAPLAAGSCRRLVALACESGRCCCPVRTWLSYDEALRSLHVQPMAPTAANAGKVKSQVASCTWPGAHANGCRLPTTRLWPDTRSHAAASSPNAAAVLTAAVIMLISDQNKAAMLNGV
jgi:hypothetical protein